MDRRGFFKLLNGVPTTHLKVIQKAYWLAKNAHRTSKRDTGERYFEHPREVALILIRMGHKDPDIVALALTHDICEDTNTPHEVIADLFDHLTWQRLLLLSKVIPSFDPVTGQTNGRAKKSREDYYLGLRDADLPVRLVKCADRLHNLCTAFTWPPERKRNYLAETRTYVLPLAEATDMNLAFDLEAACTALEGSLAA